MQVRNARSRWVCPELAGREVDIPSQPVRLTPEPLDSHDCLSQGGLARWGSALLGLAALAGSAGAAQAAESVQVSTTLDLPADTMEDSDELGLEPGLRLLSDTTLSTTRPPAATSASFSHSNDSLPAALRGLTSPDETVPGNSNRADDDGWTAELDLNITHTRGDEQWVGAGRYSMLTQQGAWQPSADYRGLRTDLAEVALQKNHRLRSGDRLQVYYGYGAGLQASGNLGGRDFQEWFHLNGGFGGRTGEALQRNYSTSEIDWAPILTGGVGADYELTQGGGLSLTGSALSTVPLGPGYGTVRGQMGLAARPHSRVTFEVGAKLDGAWATSDAYDFYSDIDGVRAGAYVSSEVKLTENLRAFARVDEGGWRDEPVYTIGITIGGAQPWLHPLR